MPEKNGPKKLPKPATIGVKNCEKHLENGLWQDLGFCQESKRLAGIRILPLDFSGNRQTSMILSVPPQFSGNKENHS
jgi:hypothetical protein